MSSDLFFIMSGNSDSEVIFWIILSCEALMSLLLLFVLEILQLRYNQAGNIERNWEACRWKQGNLILENLHKTSMALLWVHHTCKIVFLQSPLYCTTLEWEFLIEYSGHTQSSNYMIFISLLILLLLILCFICREYLTNQSAWRYTLLMWWT